LQGPTKNPNYNFWFENITSGNRGSQHTKTWLRLTMDRERAVFKKGISIVSSSDLRKTQFSQADFFSSCCRPPFFKQEKKL
jgi:hypothetical protein